MTTSYDLRRMEIAAGLAQAMDRFNFPRPLLLSWGPDTLSFILPTVTIGVCHYRSLWARVSWHGRLALWNGDRSYPYHPHIKPDAGESCLDKNALGAAAQIFQDGDYDRFILQVLAIASTCNIGNSYAYPGGVLSCSCCSKPIGSTWDNGNYSNFSRCHFCTKQVCDECLTRTYMPLYYTVYLLVRRQQFCPNCQPKLEIVPFSPGSPSLVAWRKKDKLKHRYCSGCNRLMVLTKQEYELYDQCRSCSRQGEKSNEILETITQPPENPFEGLLSILDSQGHG